MSAIQLSLPIFRFEHSRVSDYGHHRRAKRVSRRRYHRFDTDRRVSRRCFHAIAGYWPD